MKCFVQIILIILSVFQLSTFPISAEEIQVQPKPEIWGCILPDGTQAKIKERIGPFLYCSHHGTVYCSASQIYGHQGKETRMYNNEGCWITLPNGDQFLAPVNTDLYFGRVYTQSSFTPQIFVVQVRTDWQIEDSGLWAVTPWGERQPILPGGIDPCGVTIYDYNRSDKWWYWDCDQDLFWGGDLTKIKGYWDYRIEYILPIPSIGESTNLTYIPKGEHPVSSSVIEPLSVNEINNEMQILGVILILGGILVLGIVSWFFYVRIRARHQPNTTITQIPEIEQPEMPTQAPGTNPPPPPGFQVHGVQR